MIDGYSARARAGALLSGLGLFSVERHDDPVSSILRRLAHASQSRAGADDRSDLLLLDEPTNHLDLDAVLWLEDWLEALPGNAAAHHPRSRFSGRGRRRDRPPRGNAA